jgi:zinc protease
MKKLLDPLRLPILAVFLAAPTWAVPPPVPETAPLEIKVPEPKVHILSCGLKVLLLKDDGMPLVQGNLYLRGGASCDPEGKEGLTSLVNECLRDGGAGELSPEAFDEALEDKAASLGVSSDLESTTVSFQCLSGDLSSVMDLFGSMMRRPRFEAKRLETSRELLLDGTRRLEDAPRVLFRKALFGRHPYGRWESPKSLAGLGRADVAKFYAERYGPEGAVLSVAGSFDEVKVLARLEGLFSGWKATGRSLAFGDPTPLGPAIYFFPKDVTQVMVRLGYRGLKRHDPQQVPLEVADYVWGGSGFTSRLMQKIRSDRGLVYFVNSYALPFRIPGLFQVVGGTRPEALEEYLTLLFRMAEEYAKEGPTAGEMSDAKRSMIEEYAGNFESTFKVAAYRGSLDFNGYPEDHLRTYREKVRAVTREQAAHAAKDVLSQKDWVLVVCGPASLEKVLAKFGKVQVVKSLFDPLK